MDPTFFSLIKLHWRRTLVLHNFIQRLIIIAVILNGYSFFIGWLIIKNKHIENQEVFLYLRDPVPPHPERSRRTEGEGVLFYGTGSYPCPAQGWHLITRFAVSHKPFIGPYFFKASIPYCEQVGVYRHLEPSHGEMTHWYSLIKAINGKLSICRKVFMCDFNKPR